MPSGWSGSERLGVMLFVRQSKRSNAHLPDNWDECDQINGFARFVCLTSAVGTLIVSVDHVLNALTMLDQCRRLPFVHSAFAGTKSPPPFS